MDLDLINKWESDYYPLDFVEDLKSPPDSNWLNWRSDTGTDADPVVETGNRKEGFNADLYEGWAALNPGNIHKEGRKSNQVVLIAEDSGAYFFTFCQYTYYVGYDKHDNPTGGNVRGTTCKTHLAP